MIPALSPAAIFGLAGASLLVVAGALPERLQVRFRRACLTAVVAGVALVAVGAALFLGGGK